MSEPNYAEILSEKYPGNEWVIKGNEYKSIIWSDKNATPLPSQEELDALWPEVEIGIETEKVERTKDFTFQEKYTLQEQVIITARAVQTGDLKDLNDMLAAWDGL